MSLDINVELDYPNFHLACQLNLDPNGITGILGHSGSGKTTLLRILAGLNSHAKGQVYFNQECLQDTYSRSFLPTEKRHIGMVFQDARLFPHLSVIENLQFAINRQKSPKLKVNEIIKLTAINSLLAHHVEQLSAGQKQRVALARALLAEPKLLLLDEPLSALDTKARIDLLNLLRKIHQQLKIPLIYVSHNISEIQQLADHVLVMEQGKVIKQGHVHQVINNLEQQLQDEYSLQTSLTLTVCEHLPQYGLTRLSLSPQLPEQTQLFANFLATNATRVRCFILAKDINISLQPLQGSSMMNSLPGTISTIKALDDIAILLKVSVQAVEFNITITRYSLEHLKLAPQQKIYLHFKANAIQSFDKGNPC
ncbi:molybdenum ABC transporter ATP-binding protein [Thalassotalea aquiviva]|uniref:molybdenum ABC transporter ATP-binding protein n=1 Tax=Thalassotalea aquiviva TaxID=3242415 RepID=UPI00352A2530